MRPKNLLPLLSLCVLDACGGGGSTAPLPTSVVALATPTPNSTPTSAPSSAPTSGPTATPVPLVLRQMGGAPLTATASQLSTARRSAQSGTQGVTNGLPILVESSGIVATWAGDQAVWSTNITTGQDIPETGLTVTPSGALPINNPAPAPLSCLGSVSAVCTVHPMAFEFGTSSANGKPVGKQTLTITFADGTTGTTADYVYDGWSLPCNAGWAYVGGVPVAQATRATSDVYADCVNGNIVFPRGATLAFNPSQDQYGRYETILPTITAPIFFSVSTSNISMASITQGQVWGIATQDGGYAKIYMSGSASSTATGIFASVMGMSLHAAVNGTYPF